MSLDGLDENEPFVREVYKRRIRWLESGLQAIINGDPNGGTFSGSQCVEIAQAALGVEHLMPEQEGK